VGRHSPLTNPPRSSRWKALAEQHADLSVLLDGGVRRGADVAKALALGARAVLLGRPQLWGLAVAGEAGVAHVLEIYRRELDRTMGLIGARQRREAEEVPIGPRRHRCGRRAMRKLSEIEKQYLRKEPVRFDVGDIVDVGVVITETVEKKGKLEEKERVQVFGGRVIARRGTGVNEFFTVRRIVAGEGVERVFPVHSPKVAYVSVTGSARVRRAKLYFLRERSGKSTRLRERIANREPAAEAAPADATA